VTPTLSSFDETLLILRIAMVAVLYLFILQVVLVARRDLRLAAYAPLQAASRQAIGRLVVVDSGQSPLLPGTEVDILRSMTLGRSPTNTVVLDSPVVSTENTRIYYQNNALWVEDLKSTNGTFVNDRRVVVPIAVRPGDTLRVGDIMFKFAETRR
jgi:pSer/pThr/pTyr-binding forkhead associated (FHA) protein